MIGLGGVADVRPPTLTLTRGVGALKNVGFGLQAVGFGQPAVRAAIAAVGAQFRF